MGLCLGYANRQTQLAPQHTQIRLYNSDWGLVVAELKAYDDTILILDMKRVLHVLSSKTGEKEAEPKLRFAPRPFVLPIAEKQLLLFADLQGRIRVQTVSR